MPVKPWLLLIVTAALTACGGLGSGSDPTPVPAPVANLIHELQTQPPANPPAYVASYQYQGEIVYYVPPRCCDIFSSSATRMADSPGTATAAVPTSLANGGTRPSCGEPTNNCTASHRRREIAE